MAASVMPYVARQVKAEEYDEFKEGFSCRRLSRSFTPGGELKKTESYLLEEDKMEETGRFKMARLDLSQAELVRAFQTAVTEQDSKIRALQSQFQGLEAEIEAKVEHHTAELRAKVARLELYQRLGTTQKLATCELITFFCNELSWAVRQHMSEDLKQKKVTPEAMFGVGQAFGSWNDVSYPKLQWELFWDSRLKRETKSMLEYWRGQGYTGTELPEPEPPKQVVFRGENNVKKIKEYLRRAEVLVAKKAGIARSEIRLLCGVYVTCIRESRNSEVHAFSLREPLWQCNVKEEGTAIPTSTLNKAMAGPSVNAVELSHLRLKLSLLNKVVEEVHLLPGYFESMSGVIRRLGGAIRGEIGRSAGKQILRLRDSWKPLIPAGRKVAGTSLCFTENGVRDTRTGALFNINEKTGAWSSPEGIEFDPTACDLFLQD